ncbi:PKD domain-containing protein [Flaviaesturariibacter amylovorans]|uniref:PKD domain-containing protein n=1 Tax=Flaviaesturariibacter amylovorans TaxID=1084520 RepID=A0ABP8H4D0_9BACT
MFFQKSHLAAPASFAALLFLFACSKKGSDNSPDPIASFTYSAIASNLHAPATLKFSNSSTNANDYYWTFGDGGTSGTREPQHRYAAAGTYTVRLAAGSGSKSHSAIQSITILPAHTAVKIIGLKVTSVQSQTSTFTGYFKITSAAGTTLWQSANTSINPASVPLSYNIAGPALNNLSATYNIELWKTGTFSDSKLYFTSFIPSLYNNGTEESDSYPTTFSGSNGLRFTVQWQ